MLRLVRNRWRHHIALGIGLAIIVAAAGYFVVIYLQNIPKTPTTSSQQTETKKPQPVSITSNTLFFGTTFWGRYTNDWSMKSPLKERYPFARLTEFNREEYDAWISGLECPSVPDYNPSSAEQEATLQFNCLPSYLPEAAKWINIMSLATNHTDGRGAEGFSQTQKQLQKVGIQYIGHYDYKNEDDICEVVSLPTKITYDNKTSGAGAIPIALCGYQWVYGIPPASALQVMKKYSELMPVIAMPHGGAEYQAAPDQIKTNLYRAMIDNGADMVIADHPHWVQTTESYKGHLIVYSMGNFMFDQQGNAEVTRSAAVRVFFSTNTVSPEELTSWLQIGQNCKTYHDDCLDQAKAANLHKLPFTYQFDAIATDDSGKQTHRASAETEAQILKRLRWNETMQKLTQPFGAIKK
jgi:poly-gamma-glutamate synthesis protein (capsule biosynthesis protein)